MGAETKYPQYTLPRALKVSVFLVFAVNALFQWFLVGLVPHEFYHILAVADAPYAEGLRAAGLVGFPIILLCIRRRSLHHQSGNCSTGALHLHDGGGRFPAEVLVQGTSEV